MLLRRDRGQNNNEEDWDTLPTMKFVQIKGRSQTVSQDVRTNAAADVQFMPYTSILGIEHTIAFVHFLSLE